MGEIAIGKVKISYTLPTTTGTSATAQRDDGGTAPNWDAIPGLGTSYAVTKLCATEEIGFSSFIEVSCPLANKQELKNIEIGFVQTVDFSDRCAAYPIDDTTGSFQIYQNKVNWPIKDGEGDPWYRDYDPSLVCWDDDDLSSWTGHQRNDVFMSDSPSFSYPKELGTGDAARPPQEVANSQVFNVALIVRQTPSVGVPINHFLFTLEWTMRMVITQGELLGFGAYSVKDPTEIPAIQRTDPRPEFVLEGASANRSSRTALVQGNLA